MHAITYTFFERSVTNPFYAYIQKSTKNTIPPYNL